MPIGSRTTRHNRGSIFVPSPSGGGSSTQDVVIATTTLPHATESSAYSTAIVASFGTTPYSFTVSSGSLPTGLSLSTSGTISGTPSASGTSSFTVTVTDAGGDTDDQALSLVVDSAGTAPTVVTIGTLFWSGAADLSNQNWPGGFPHIVDLGIDAVSVQTGYLAGYGGSGNWSTTSGTGNGVSNQQQSIVGSPSNNVSFYGSTPAYLGLYFGAGANNGPGGPGTDYPVLQDDSGWDSLCESLQHMSAWASTHNWRGIALDWEYYTYGPRSCWSWLDPQWSSLGESAVRTLAQSRGQQFMQALVNGWSTTHNPLRIIQYTADMPGTWREQQFIWSSGSQNLANAIPDGLQIDFWTGASAVSGSWTVFFLEAAFYKYPQGIPGTSWADALAWDKSAHRSIFNANFDSPERFLWAPFGWIDSNPASGSEQEQQVHSVSEVQGQFDAFANEAEGLVAIYDYGGDFDYDDYSGAITAYSPS